MPGYIGLTDLSLISGLSGLSLLTLITELTGLTGLSLISWFTWILCPILIDWERNQSPKSPLYKIISSSNFSDNASRSKILLLETKVIKNTIKIIILMIFI